MDRPPHSTRQLSRQHSYLDNLTILDPTHCKVEGLAPDYFDGWHSSSHGRLTNLPPGTKSVVVVAGTTDPTYINYDFGKGEVEATMQTVEFGDSTKGRPGLLLNELKCCQEYVPPSPVGGEAYPINKAPVLAPWIGLAVLFVAGGTILARRRRIQG